MRVVGAALLVAVAIAAVVISFTGLPSGEPDAIELLTAKVKRGDARTEVAGSGTVAPASTIELSFGTDSTSAGAGGVAGSTASAASTVRSISVRRGQRVRRGQVLARLDRTAARLDLQAAQNTYDAAVAARDEPTTTTQGGTTTQAQSDEQLDLAVAEAAVSLEAARQSLAATVLRSPRTAIVDSVDITVGSAPASGSPAITLRSAGMQVSIDVAEDDIGDVRVGQVAEVRITALDVEVAGTVTSIDAQDDTSTSTSSPTGAGAGAATASGAVTFPVAVALDKLPRGIRSGMSAEVTIITAERTRVLIVPVTAISGSGSSTTARVPDGDGGITQQQIKVGLVTSSTAEVVSGLKEGATVVTGVVTPQAKEEDSSSSSALGGGGGFGGGMMPPGGGFSGGPPPGAGFPGGAQGGPRG